MSIVEERKQKIKKILIEKKNWIIYLVLVFLLWINIKIRTSNLWGLKNIVTGEWTLGPDLDPFLFMRYAKIIVEQGSLPAIDMMRYVPLGFNTKAELNVVSYGIVYLHKFLNLFSSPSVEYTSVIFPVVASVFMAIAFFLLVRKIFINFHKKNYVPEIIALLSTAFLITLPSLLPRTIAGIPEKESIGFFFVFLSLYLFLCSWQAKKTKNRIILGILAGLSTVALANAWGGSIFVYFTIAVSFFIAFIFGKIRKKELISYSSWTITYIIFISIFSARGFTLKSLVTSSSTATMLFVFAVMVLDYILFNTKIKKYKLVDRYEKKLTRQVFSIIVALVLGILFSVLLLGTDFIYNFISDIVGKLTTPYVDRLSFTIAENRQPYFSEWKSNFGPVIKNFAMFFWLFFIGSIFLFYETMKKIAKKERIILTLVYILVLFGLIFSRNSQSSVLNGTNSISLFLYFGSIIIFGLGFIYVYYKYVKENKTYLFRKISFNYIFIFMFFFLSLVAARSAIRLIMVLSPVASIIISFFAVYVCVKALKNKSEFRIIYIVFAILILLLTFYTLNYNYNSAKNQASVFVPSVYTHQWQKAMNWVDVNTNQEAVFGHWWDYGYWVQSIGNRATVLDGGNVYHYWDYLMGRHALTGLSEQEALDFLYSHDTTHFLIDSSDIGKYGAFSSIGSDLNYDRRSWIPTNFVMNEAGTQETANSTIYYYAMPAGNNRVGIYPLDEDIVYKQDNKEIFLPSGAAGVIGILLEMSDQEVIGVDGIFVYQGQQYVLPLKYAYVNNKKYEFKGLDSGIFVYTRLIQQGSNYQVNQIGALIYLTKRTVNSNLARWYLFDETENLDLVHTESSLFVENIRNNGLKTGEFVLFNDFYGPIKIWEINYPSDMKINETYLETSFPDKRLAIA